MLRVKGYAYEQKLVGFKDANSFNEKVDENDDNLFYELLDDEPDYCQELEHQYVLSGEGEVQLYINVWVNNPIVLPSVIIYGSDKDFKEYMKGFKAKLKDFIALLRDTQKKMTEEELIKKMVFEEDEKSN